MARLGFALIDSWAATLAGQIIPLSPIPESARLESIMAHGALMGGEGREPHGSWLDQLVNQLVSASAVRTREGHVLTIRDTDRWLPEKLPDGARLKTSERAARQLDGNELQFERVHSDMSGPATIIRAELTQPADGITDLVLIFEPSGDEHSFQ